MNKNIKFIAKIRQEKLAEQGKQPSNLSTASQPNQFQLSSVGGAWLQSPKQSSLTSSGNEEGFVIKSTDEMIMTTMDSGYLKFQARQLAAT
mmetsp:Transcript_23959/g.18285  ORF Transcript_23959/g.18285 Transcript_23959/m.18285 type:complete len:91 (+) Transcript_23959:1438-1710(+)